MRVRVKLMRRRGVRLPGRDIANSPTFEGELSAAYVRQHFFASLRDPQSNVNAAVLPDLYEAVLIGLGSDLLILRGIERIDTPQGRMAVVQDWRCELLR
jgi:hypothetical protein